MNQVNVRGIVPILVTPFDGDGRVDEDSLRQAVQFEVDCGVDAIAVGGFVSEAYKLSEREQMRCVEVTADEIAGRVPLVIGMAPGSTETAIEQAVGYAKLNPAVLMTLPPCTLHNDESALVEFFVRLGQESSVPIMVRQAPQFPGYSGCQFHTEALARLAYRAPNVRYFKIEGPGSSKRIHSLLERSGQAISVFGGASGPSLAEELRAGAAGIMTGCGLSDVLLHLWAAWQADHMAQVDDIMRHLVPLIETIEGYGHEYSLHARKFLLQRAGIISHAHVRQPTVRPEWAALEALGRLADSMDLRITRFD